MDKIGIGSVVFIVALQCSLCHASVFAVIPHEFQIEAYLYDDTLGVTTAMQFDRIARDITPNRRFDGFHVLLEAEPAINTTQLVEVTQDGGTQSNVALPYIASFEADIAQSHQGQFLSSVGDASTRIKSFDSSGALIGEADLFGSRSVHDIEFNQFNHKFYALVEGIVAGQSEIHEISGLTASLVTTIDVASATGADFSIGPNGLIAHTQHDATVTTRTFDASGNPVAVFANDRIVYDIAFHPLSGVLHELREGAFAGSSTINIASTNSTTPIYEFQFPVSQGADLAIIPEPSTAFLLLPVICKRRRRRFRRGSQFGVSDRYMAVGD